MLGNGSWIFLDQKFFWQVNLWVSYLISKILNTIIDKIIKHWSYNFEVKITEFFRKAFHEHDCAPKVEESTQLRKFLLSCESGF